jgi:hypothetical protein
MGSRGKEARVQVAKSIVGSRLRPSVDEDGSADRIRLGGMQAFGHFWSAQDLLAKNDHFLMPRMDPDVSPYDVMDRQQKGFSGVSDFMGVGSAVLVTVENFDPQSSDRCFTEPATITACENLGFRQSDLFFPTEEELQKIAGDRVLYRKRLESRALSFARLVKAERERVIRSRLRAAGRTIMARDRNGEDPGKDIPKTKSESLLVGERDQPLTKVGRKLRDGALRAKGLEETELKERKQLVDEKEKRRQAVMHNLMMEKVKEVKMQRETNLEKRKRSQMFHERMKEERMRRLETFDRKSQKTRPRSSMAETPKLSEYPNIMAGMKSVAKIC